MFTHLKQIYHAWLGFSVKSELSLVWTGSSSSVKSGIARLHNLSIPRLFGSFIMTTASKAFVLFKGEYSHSSIEESGKMKREGKWREREIEERQQTSYPQQRIGVEADSLPLLYASGTHLNSLHFINPRSAERPNMRWIRQLCCANALMCVTRIICL